MLAFSKAQAGTGAAAASSRSLSLCERATGIKGNWNVLVG